MLENYDVQDIENEIYMWEFVLGHLYGYEANTPVSTVVENIDDKIAQLETDAQTIAEREALDCN